MLSQSARLLSSDPIILGQQTGSNRLCFFRCKWLRQISLWLRLRPAELILPNRSTSCLLHWPQQPPPRLRGRVKLPECCQLLSKQQMFCFRSFVWLENYSRASRLRRKRGLLFFSLLPPLLTVGVGCLTVTSSSSLIIFEKKSTHTHTQSRATRHATFSCERELGRSLWSRQQVLSTVFRLGGVGEPCDKSWVSYLSFTVAQPST